MVNIKIAYDNQDTKLGHYFGSCKQDIVDFITDELGDVTIHEINSTLCNTVHIDLNLSNINPAAFLFIAYSHGNENCLIVDGDAYVDGEVNSHLFINSVFYSIACLIGRELGNRLIDNGCKAFIGYDDEIEVFIDENMAISIGCDNSGIKAFLAGKTIGESVNAMRKYYSYKIAHLSSLNQNFLVAQLVHSRESLVFYGDADVTLTHLTE